MPDLDENLPKEVMPALAKPEPPPALFERDFTIRGISLNLTDIDELFELLDLKTNEARALEVGHAIATADPKNPPAKDVLESSAAKNFRISHTVRDATGRLGLSGFDKPDLKSGYVSHEIASLWFSNSDLFQKTFQALPRNYVHVFIDFKRPSMALNLLNLPSNPTPNGSCLNVKGIDEQWVVSTHQRLVEFFDQRRTWWGWLHSSGVYDVFLYIFVVPFLLFKAFQFEEYPPAWLETDSNVVLVAIYVYGFLISFILARQVFMGARWMFPAVEFASGRRRAPTIYRVMFGVLVMGLTGWALQNLIVAIFF